MGAMSSNLIRELSADGFVKRGLRVRPRPMHGKRQMQPTAVHCPTNTVSASPSADL